MPHRITLITRADIGRDEIAVVVTGCLTAQTSPQLARRIDQARAQDPSLPVVVDLREADHIDRAAFDHLRAGVEIGPDNPDHRAEVRLVGPCQAGPCPHATEPSA